MKKQILVDSLTLEALAKQYRHYSAMLGDAEIAVDTAKEKYDNQPMPADPEQERDLYAKYRRARKQEAEAGACLHGFMMACQTLNLYGPDLQKVLRDLEYDGPMTYDR